MSDNFSRFVQDVRANMRAHTEIDENTTARTGGTGTPREEHLVALPELLVSPEEMRLLVHIGRMHIKACGNGGQSYMCNHDQFRFAAYMRAMQPNMIATVDPRQPIPHGACVTWVKAESTRS